VLRVCCYFFLYYDRLGFALKASVVLSIQRNRLRAEETTAGYALVLVVLGSRRNDDAFSNANIRRASLTNW
jgi:hypothetical protein